MFEMTQLLIQILEIAGRYFKRQAVLGFRQAEVAVQQDVILVINKQYRDVVVGLDDAEQEIHIGHTAAHGVTLIIHLAGVVAHCRQLLSRVSPNLHTLTLLLGEVLHQVVGDVQEQRHQHQRDGEEHHLPDAA